MSFETTSLLLNWVQLGVLLAILFRLHHTFDLIANTQRELRRAVHRLADRRAAERGVSDGFRNTALASPPSSAVTGAESAIGADDLPRLSPSDQLLNTHRPAH
jgi:hypothetical protein